ncbi:MAG: hypothetical protein GC192_20285 [Bacteroidetes bacterium]|nr:hypothetical protein [Bacteroidota bacterium]
MSDCAEILNPKRVEREGTSQTERMQSALHPDFVKLVEHGPADWMVFAKRLAANLHFFNSDNVDAGTWELFFAKDPSVLLAMAAVQRVDFYKQNIQSYLKYLLDSDNEANDAELKKRFGYIFDSVGTLATQLDFLLAALPDEIGLKTVLQNLICSQLAEPFERLKLHYDAAVTANLIDLLPLPQWSILGSDILDFEETRSRSFSQDWNSGTDWTGFDAEAILGDPAGTVFERLNFAAGHNLFSDILDQFLKVYARVVAEAKTSLEKTLTELNSHEPHYALFLAFLRLMEYARDHANTLTARHLDYYYKEVLQLKKRPAEPNQAHLVFELAKHKESHLIPSGTAFKAGKDSAGKPVEYHLSEDFVANRASVSRLQSLHHASQLFAFPISNSKDGRGAELDSEDGQWDAFVRTGTSSDLAKVGFAIASHYLYLREGERRIRLRLKAAVLPKNALSKLAFCQAFDYYLTGEKGWVKATLDTAKITGGNLTANIEIPLLLDGGQPAIVPLSAKPHGDQLPEGLPTLKVLLRQDGGANLSVRSLQEMSISPAQSALEVAVGYDDFDSNTPNGQGLKDLQIVSKLGTLKPDKPFLPFGPQPEKGDALIIGSDEALQKAGASFQFQVHWKGLPDWRGDLDYDWVNEFTPRLNLLTLKNGVWESAGATDNDGLPGLKVFNEEINPKSEFVFPPKRFPLLAGQDAEPHFDQRSYGVGSRNGYFRLELLGDFGHKLYQMTLPRYLMRVALQPDTLVSNRGTLRDLVYKLVDGRYVPKNIFTFTQDYVEHFSKAMPTPPYTPELESLSLSYMATVSLADATTDFYQITPFGFCEAAGQSPANLPLLKGWQTQGELFIGVEGLKPPQNLSLLFQLAEGSADPTVLKPEKHLTWSYLSGNEWRDFTSAEFSDQTGQLTQSGILRFSVPKDATNDDTRILPKGIHWLRMSLTEKPEAICKIISITAQAALATFADNDNAANFLAAQTPAGTVAKFVLPDSAVKKLVQPYATFGGRQEEAEENFYTRVSERLRHKQRAITIWDYEHLVLEAFPQIFKVKCLNHTRFEPAETGKEKIYNELAPGHVTVVTIPDLLNRNAIDPLRPYTNLGDLELIKAFLQKHVSCFVQLHLHNPVYEEVRVKFRVKFFPGVDETFYTALLKKTIVQYLAPWAFGDSRDIRFGGKIYKSALIDLVEEQPYVDFVTEFQLFHEASGEDREEVQASIALAVLTPAPAERQEVQVINEKTLTAADTCRC